MSEDQVFLVGGRFRVTIEEATDVTFVAVVEEVTGWDADNGAPVEFEPYIARFFMKWDACAQIDFGPIPLHLCGVQDFVDHDRLVRELCELGFARMGRQPGGAWPE